MEGRTGHQCRQRWIEVLDPTFNRNPFTPEEDDIIMKNYKEIGPKWSEIAKYLPGRTGIAVRRRWLYLRRRTTAPISQITPLNLRQAVGAVAPSLPILNRGLVVSPQAQLAPQFITPQPAVQPAAVAPPAAQPQDDPFGLDLDEEIEWGL